MRYYFAALFITVFFIVPWMAINHPGQMVSFFDQVSLQISQLTAVVVHNPKTVAGLQSTYNISAAKGLAKIRILIVPGHSPNDGGAEYGSLKERDIAVELSQYLSQFLSSNSRFQIYITRDEKDWNPVFEKYFNENKDVISNWVQAHKAEINSMKKIGEFESRNPSVIHNKVSNSTAYNLYGISKWANENSIDIIIHVHFNDYPRYGSDTPGKYNGFAIYVPEKQYLNSSTTNTLSQAIYKRLAKYNPISNFPGEKEGIIEDQDLIAVGSYNSLDAASMLIEYGYIYEPQFTSLDLQEMALKDLAYQTYLGLHDFFDPTSSITISRAYDTLLLPYEWSPNNSSHEKKKDIFALQTALMHGGLYPPSLKKMNDCPRTGVMGPCTEKSLSTFQTERGIIGENGKLGPRTMKELNQMFGAVPI